MLRDMQSNLGRLWCALMHESVMWPVHGEYECRTCGRRYPAFIDAPPARWPKAGAFKTAAPLMLAATVIALATPLHAGNALKGHPTLQAAAALERYAATEAPVPWALESVEIHAALPKLAKTGELLAIRRQSPVGAVNYQVLQFTGDSTVKQQVIVRYLKTDARAPEIPAGAVAITPLNYKFAYKGEIDDGETLAYAFRITPRKKRGGLIAGELWLDQWTGSVVRQSGTLVKNPSLWIRRIAITRENKLRDGTVESRLTHIYIDARLVGRAELVIEERPLNPAEVGQISTYDNGGGEL